MDWRRKCRKGVGGAGKGDGGSGKGGGGAGKGEGGSRRVRTKSGED